MAGTQNIVNVFQNNAFIVLTQFLFINGDTINSKIRAIIIRPYIPPGKTPIISAIFQPLNLTKYMFSQILLTYDEYI
jgi:hypothetical protein